MSLPAKGGSYVRKADGTLDRVAWTQRSASPAPTPAAAAKPVVPQAPEPSSPDPAATKKGEK